LYTSERGWAQEPFDQGRVQLPAAHLCVPAGRADDVEAVLQVGLQRGRIVAPHQREELLVAFFDRLPERLLK
jgi:hypothetical protein